MFLSGNFQLPEFKLKSSTRAKHNDFHTLSPSKLLKKPYPWQRHKPTKPINSSTSPGLQTHCTGWLLWHIYLYSQCMAVLSPRNKLTVQVDQLTHSWSCHCDSGDNNLSYSFCCCLLWFPHRIFVLIKQNYTIYKFSKGSKRKILYFSTQRHRALRFWITQNEIHIDFFLF